MRQRKQILRETKWKNITSTINNKINEQNLELDNVHPIQEDGHGTVRQEDDNNMQYDNFDSILDCDINEGDEVENNAMAVLQHYIIVWLSIITSPKGKLQKKIFIIIYQKEKLVLYMSSDLVFISLHH